MKDCVPLLTVLELIEWDLIISKIISKFLVMWQYITIILAIYYHDVYNIIFYNILRSVEILIKQFNKL